MTEGRFIVNSTLALSIACGITMILVGIVYADREKQLDAAANLADRFHQHESNSREVISELRSRDSMCEERIANLGKMVEEVRNDIKTLLTRTRK